MGANESLTVVNTCYFDTLKVHVAGGQDAMKALRARAESKRVNLRYYPDGEHVGISLHERINRNDFSTLCSVLGVSPVQGVLFEETFWAPWHVRWITSTTPYSTATARDGDDALHQALGEQGFGRPTP